VIHHAHSEQDAESVREEVVNLGRKAWVFQADLSDSAQAEDLIPLNQAFARQAAEGADHFPYTISNAALAALTNSMAVALAPKITVNGLALGAILPPADGNKNPAILQNVPAKRWAQEGEVQAALLFLRTGTAYITGEIIHVDGGRHLI
jgi:NAD(P)-dependent dehydrogenase (short-subunit alcohol dehydrogenase family)